MTIEEKLEYAKQELSKGKSQRKIAKELGVHHSTYLIGSSKVL